MALGVAHARRHAEPMAWRAEFDLGIRPLTAVEGASPGDRRTVWSFAALGGAIEEQAAFLFHDDETRTGHAVDRLCVVVPFWLLAAVAFPAPLLWLARRRHDRHERARARDGLCPACGYDLRASAGRCPECGAAARSTEAG